MNTYLATVLVVHLAATGYMTGLIWFVQLVHYPLMKQVGASGYEAYQRLHMRRTTWAVSPMLGEAGACIALFAFPSVPLWAKVLGGVLLALIWVSTALLSVPAHERLSAGFQAAAHETLVRTNWIRTGAWTARLVFAGWLIVAQLS